jgi:hypothetical protein
LNSKAHNLTGVWHGYYGYPGAELTVDVMATLLEAGSQFSGSISEPAILDDAAGDTLFTIVSGGREGGTVSFEKTHEGDRPNYNIVRYTGQLAEDGQEIEGRWTIPGSWSGRFLMIRSGDAKAATDGVSSVTIEKQLVGTRK